MASTKKSPKTMVLTHVRMVKREDRVRSRADARRWVSRETHSFRDEDGAEYRKAVEVKVGEYASVPPTGTHDTYRRAGLW